MNKEKRRPNSDKNNFSLVQITSQSAWPEYTNACLGCPII